MSVRLHKASKQGRGCTRSCTVPHSAHVSTCGLPLTVSACSNEWPWRTASSWTGAVQVRSRGALLP